MIIVDYIFFTEESVKIQLDSSGKMDGHPSSHWES